MIISFILTTFMLKRGIKDGKLFYIGLTCNSCSEDIIYVVFLYLGKKGVICMCTLTSLKSRPKSLRPTFQRACHYNHQWRSVAFSAGYSIIGCGKAWCS